MLGALMVGLLSLGPHASAQPARAETGKGTWYTYRPGVCAHRTLPFGTVVTVTRAGTVKSVRCTVRDRGPFVAGLIIDLHVREFERLAPRSAGVVRVRLTW